MPRNLSAWIDLSIHLFVILMLIGILSCYNHFIAAISFVVWLCLAFFAKERCHDRSRRFERYCRNVVRNLNEMMNYAIEDLPQGILIVNQEGRIQWCNERMAEYAGTKPEQDTDVKDIWPAIIIGPVWGTVGEYVFANEDHYYQVRYRPVPVPPHQTPLMALYVQDITGFETLRNSYKLSRTVLAYIQIDNYDEVIQGLDEAARTALLLSVNQQLDNWMKSLGGFMRRVSDDLYVVILERKALDKAIAARFDILDKVRQLHSANRLPVTLSMGVAPGKLTKTRSMVVPPKPSAFQNSPPETDTLFFISDE